MLWSISVILLAVSISAIVANYSISIRWYLFKKRASLIPFIGGILGTVGIVCLPVVSIRRFWWIPLVADPGCILLLVGVLVDQFRKRIRPS